MEIRIATADDIEKVLSFWKSAAAAPSVSDDSVGLLRLLERDPGALMLTEDASGIAGTIIAAWDGWRGHVYRLAVRPDRRREGVARTLVAAAEARLVGLGAPKVQGIVLADNAAAQSFWTASGYPHDGTVQRHTRTFPIE